MRQTRLSRKSAAFLFVSGGTLLQFSACFGPDPQFFVTSSVVNAVISNLVGTLFNSLFAAVA